MPIILFLLRSSRAIVVLALIAGIVSGVSSSGLIAIVHVSLDHVGSTTPLLVTGFVVLCVVLPVSRLISQILLVKLSQKAVFDLRIQLCRQILGTPLRHLEEIGAHRLMAALTDDVMVISAGLIGIPMLCLQLAVLTGSLVYMGWLSRMMVLGVIVFLILGMTSVQIGVRKAIRYLSKARIEQDALFKHLRALTEGSKELKLHYKRREAFLSEVLQSTAASYQHNNLYGNAILTAAITWAHLLFFILMGLLILVLPRITSVDPQTLNGFTLVLLYLLIPLDVIGSVLPNLGRANVALKNVKSLGLALASQSPHEDLPVVPLVQTPWRSLELTGVTHAYLRERENSSFIVGPIDITLRPGELIFIVGGNGSGKTTLAKLLTGLYVPQTGEIRLNGEPITDQNREYYRQHFSVVFSDYYLFESLLGLDTKELDADACEYLSRLQLDHKVQIKDGELSTIDLSQGQRKRLALLTAYLEDRPIYLFDEWAADQDPLFKKVFYEKLLPELRARGKAIIVISHDDRYYFVADRIIKLDYGMIEYDRVVVPSANQETGVAQSLR